MKKLLLVTLVVLTLVMSACTGYYYEPELTDEDKDTINDAIEDIEDEIDDATDNIIDEVKEALDDLGPLENRYAFPVLLEGDEVPEILMLTDFDTLVTTEYEDLAHSNPGIILEGELEDLDLNGIFPTSGVVQFFSKKDNNEDVKLMLISLQYPTSIHAKWATLEMFDYLDDESLAFFTKENYLVALVSEGYVPAPTMAEIYSLLEDRYDTIVFRDITDNKKMPDYTSFTAPFANTEMGVITLDGTDLIIEVPLINYAGVNVTIHPATEDDWLVNTYGVCDGANSTLNSTNWEPGIDEAFILTWTCPDAYIEVGTRMYAGLTFMATFEGKMHPEAYYVGTVRTAVQ